MKTEED